MPESVLTVRLGSLGLTGRSRISAAVGAMADRRIRVGHSLPRRGDNSAADAITASGTVHRVGLTAADLAAALVASPESDYVRVTADWLRHGQVSVDDPGLTGRPVVDALVAAAVAQIARLAGTPAPAWTTEEQRFLPSFWHPGGDRFFAWSLAHAPAEFSLRGLVIEDDSLASV